MFSYKENKEEVSVDVFKYDEYKILCEMLEYIRLTYEQHYVGKNNIQANDLVLAGDTAEARGFWKWNAIKYLLRYGKKGGTVRKDLLKAIHYAILLVYLHDQPSKEKLLNPPLVNRSPK